MRPEEIPDKVLKNTLLYYGHRFLLRFWKMIVYNILNLEVKENFFNKSIPNRKLLNELILSSVSIFFFSLLVDATRSPDIIGFKS